MRLWPLVLLMSCSHCTSTDLDPGDPLATFYDDDDVFVRSGVLASSSGKAALAHHLETLEASLPELSLEARIVLQNDLWGLHERARREISDPELERIAGLSASIARRIAPEDVRELAPPEGLPEVVAGIAEGLVEQGTEMPILSHEAAFGFRRVFRVAMSVDGERRVIFSQLVAFDRSGRRGVTHVVGEVEYLELSQGALIGARVWKLSRGHEPRLYEVDAVDHIPSLGADSFFIREDEAVPLATLPCMRCHEDDEPHSLPRPELPVRERWDDVLEQLLVPQI